MVLPFFLIFLVFGLVTRAKMTYWRGLVGALAIQAIGANLPASWLAAPWIVWLFNWLLPLVLTLWGALKDDSLQAISRIAFMIIWSAAILFGLWDSFLPFYKNSLFNQPGAPKSETKVYPGEKAESIRDGWDPFVSDEGNFRVLSPLPAVTSVSYRDVDRQRLKITTTRIRDTPPNPSYIVVTTTYPKGFDLPDPSKQATLAMQHLLQTYGFDQLLEAKAVVQKGFDALAFEAKNSATKEAMTGLIIPAGSTLYQVMALVNADDPHEEDVAYFLISFQPLIDPASGQSLKLHELGEK